MEKMANLQKKYGIEYLIFMAMVCFSLFAEKNIPQKIQELEKNLANVSRKDKVDLLNDLAYEFSRRDVQKSLDYANQAKELSISLQYWKGAVLSYNCLSSDYMICGEVN